MTGAGAPGAPGIIHCLLQEPSIRLTICDADKDAIGKHLHPDFIQIPSAKDEGFINALLSICRQKKIDVILPLVSKELLPLADNKALFQQEGCTVLVSDAAAIKVANDKSATYRFLQDAGLALPQFFVVNNTKEFAEAAKQLGYPGNTFCFKPSIANGSRGFRIVCDETHEADLLFHQKPSQTYMNYNHAMAVLSQQTFPQLLVAEFLPGEEYSVDCLANRGKAILIVPRSRQKMVNGISVKGCFEKDDNIINYCKQIIEQIGLHGNIGIQLRRSATGQPLLLEINPRVQGTIVSALGAGVNLPVLAVKVAMGVSISEVELQVKWGTCFSRYWTEVFY